MREPDDHLEEWVRAELITPEQATAIREHELTRLREARPPGLFRLAEAFGYLGGTLTVLVVLLIFEDFWELLEPGIKVSLLGVTSVVLLGGGIWLRRRESEWADRLVGFLWLGSAAAVSIGVAAVFDDMLGADRHTTWLAAGVATALYAAPLWRIRPGALQQLALFAGVAMALVSGLGQVGRVGDEGLALFLWVLGVSWAMLAWAGLTPPTRTGYALGGLTALLGAQALAFQGWGFGPRLYEAWGLALGVATSAGLMAASVAVGAPVLLGLGMAGVLAFGAQIAFLYYLQSVGMLLVLLTAGVVLVALSIGTARLGSRPRREGPMRDAAPGRRRVIVAVATIAVLLVLVITVIAGLAERRTSFFSGREDLGDPGLAIEEALRSTVPLQ